MYAVKVRLRDERSWNFLGSDGRLTRLRLHAGQTERDAALRAAVDLLANNQALVAATRVVDMESQRTVSQHGEPTPPRPAPIDLSGYRYLVAVRGDRGTFHVKDGGRWGNVSAEAYEACYAEAQRAELETRPLVIHGATCTIATRGLRFVQESNR